MLFQWKKERRTGQSEWRHPEAFWIEEFLSLNEKMGLCSACSKQIRRNAFQTIGFRITTADFGSELWNILWKLWETRVNYDLATVETMCNVFEKRIKRGT